MSIIEYLVLPKGAKKKRKRRGIGEGSGHGGTSCAGHKGQQAHGRTKASKGFEGGQMPLIRRLPKRGFINAFRKAYQIVNIEDLKGLPEDKTVTPAMLKEKGLIKSAALPLKILADGKISRRLDIQAHAFSAKAKKAIEDAGGKAVLIKG